MTDYSFTLDSSRDSFIFNTTADIAVLGMDFSSGDGWTFRRTICSITNLHFNNLVQNAVNTTTETHIHTYMHTHTHLPFSGSICQAENEEPGVMLPGHCFTIEVSTRKGKGGKREASQLLRHVPSKKIQLIFLMCLSPNAPLPFPLILVFV